jgi:Flp pilus assembly protein TadD
MRFADLVARAGVPCALALAATGCASLTEPLKAMQHSVAQTLAPATSASAPAAVSREAVPVVAEAPISPAVQRTFDDASRALRAGKVDDAERGFRALAQSNPDLGGPHANLGVIYRQAGKLAEARSELELAVRANPKQPIFLNQLGVTYRQLGQFDKARDAYERAIALDAEYAAPCLNLGILNDLYLGDGARAMELYARYLELSPEGDALVTKWVAELKNRKSAPITMSRKEKA